ncbi:S-adenosyl-L-methionine-dependent methyltransferase [Yamadazyma tenuis]|uniref:catechol O-methyltransferase n=1 Tax=Candida tenuis (strain ATCC 10573 / BCRC 21748 / CBS 615 / JCM 9827 / NBRC 10315 / NRRL Y-1498 / VKM Y-70) TaxID=590646 RepID=G3B580_CANTC|nr:S-adenosyl-L-methionine-dependent methyltransferase [Yamadazyma tenuis ATCC 10573]EGV63157.1 S-adenosyl-L-methionine-dependent methyltransferase [Yamadazyma tenuis ATCC 10573]WEJ97023.1 S-adenosyl-L-methionine-dependent methyltransferase [Yamadazyma tenuis]
MGKEQNLANHILSLPEPQLSQVRGHPAKVLRLIEDYPESFMDIGPVKGKRIIEEIQKTKPSVMIEMGGYCGYSAILFGNELKKLNGKYYSFELSDEYAEVASKLVDLAGLSGTVEIIVGPANATLPRFKEWLKEDIIDFVFIDHDKQAYTPDLRILESLDLIGVGTTIVADNIIRPGAPEYHSYVTSTPQQKNEYISVNQNPNGSQFVGRWNFVYETELIKMGQDGIDVTKVVKSLN